VVTLEYLAHGTRPAHPLEGLENVQWILPPPNETLEEFVNEIVPELLAIGGRLEAALSPSVWECHDWTNCPMAAAFGIESHQQAPLLLFLRVSQFVKLYDAGKISRLAVLVACRKKGLIP
jgi:hypothetical protein